MHALDVNLTVKDAAPHAQRRWICPTLQIQLQQFAERQFTSDDATAQCGPTQKAFTTVVSSAGDRATFIPEPCELHELQWLLDGVDLDWEYP